MKLYIANKNYSSWSLRPWVLMREKGIAFQEIITPFSDHGEVSPFINFSPTCKVPCLDDGGTLVWDSLAICEYLAENTPGCWPAERVARAWARSAAAEMHSSFQTLRTQCQMNCGVRVTLNKIDDGLRADVDRVSALWCEGLQRFGGPYLAGQTYTIVDAFFAPVIFRVQSYGLSLAAPAQAYAKHVLSLPSMRQWYDEAMREVWRKDAYEKSVASYGLITADERVAG